MENEQTTTNRTSYFTFGYGHTHSCNGQTLDRNIVVRITAQDPRKRMFELFGNKWAMEYDSLPKMEHYPRGIIDL